MSESMIFHVEMDASPGVGLKPYKTLLSFTPRVEPYSTGKWFLDFTGNRDVLADPVGLARRIKQRLAVELKLTCSIGIGCNQLIAKMASGGLKPNGVTIIKPEETVVWLHNLPIEQLPGVGTKIIFYLQGLHIRTIGELALVDEAVLVGWFGMDGTVIYKMAWGNFDGLVQQWLFRTGGSQYYKQAAQVI